MNKKAWLSAILALSVVALAACNKDEVPEQVTPEEDAPIEEIVKPETKPVVEEAPEEDTAEEEAKTILTSTGTYVGTAGEGYVKLQVGEQVAVYELIEETKGVFDGVALNTSVTFDYYEGKEGARVLVSILLNEPTKPDNETTSEVVQDEWVFVGLIDGHSSEFKKGTTYITAQYNETQLETMNALNEQDVVVVSYKKNDNGRYVLETIKKK